MIGIHDLRGKESLSFTCPHCPNVFTRNVILNRHFGSVHSATNTTETCTLCDLQLKRVDSLKIRRREN
ncbi:unnamed protein product, partial [Allacma fusca]